MQSDIPAQCDESFLSRAPVLLVDDIVPLLDKAQNDTSKHKTAEHGQCKTVQDIIDRSPGVLGESPECI